MTEPLKSTLSGGCFFVFFSLRGIISRENVLLGGTGAHPCEPSGGEDCPLHKGHLYIASGNVLRFAIGI